MKIFQKPIFAGFVPELEIKDFFYSLYFLSPFGWKNLRKGDASKKVEEWLGNYLPAPHVFSFDSGRSGLYFALKSLNLEAGTEVAMQAYTCAVVSNAIIWSGARPLYIDIDQSFNMDPEDLVRKLTSKTKVLLIQHTFGTPANISRLIKIATEHNLLIVEDCAHSLGATYAGQKTGTFGDMSIFSFGSDKVTPGIRGGAVAVHRSDLAVKLRKFQESLPIMSRAETIRNLMYYPLFAIGKFTYNFFYLGKIILAVAKKLRLISRIIEQDEKKGIRPTFFSARMPNSLAKMALKKLTKIEVINSKRRKIGDTYDKKITNPAIIKPARNLSDNTNSVNLRYTILLDQPIKLFKQALKKGIMLGDWYSSVLAPKDVNLATMQYVEGSCPRAEEMARRSLNLPTSTLLNNSDLEKIIDVVNSFQT